MKHSNITNIFYSILLSNTILYICIPAIKALSTPSSSSNTNCGASTLRKILTDSLDTKTAIPLPGVHDALSARIFCQNQIPALFVSGFGISASQYALPDAGILTLSQMEEMTQNIMSSIRSTNHIYDNKMEFPLIVDGDTGYGGAQNVQRTIHQFAFAGAAAITIEDQTFPKKCTYAAGESIQVLSQMSACRRIQTAVAAREELRTKYNKDVLIIGRTDCRAALGMEEVKERCRLFEDLGADIVYAENLQSWVEYRELREHLNPRTPMMLAQLQLGNDGTEQQRIYSLEEIGDMGYNLALFGVSALQATISALDSVAKGFSNGQVVYPMDNSKEEGETKVSLSSFSQVKNVVGFPELESFVEEFPCL